MIERKPDKRQYNMTKAIVNEQNSLEIQSSVKTISAWESQGGKRERKRECQADEKVYTWP